MYRVEDKYIIPYNDMFLLERRMSTLLTPDANNGQAGYKISSVYFDDIYDTHLTDTIDGNPIRDKYRIRIYNDSFETIKLEIKSKMYNRAEKRSADITYEQMQKLLSGKCIESSGDASSPIALFNVGINTRYLRPKVIVTYERKAYIYESGNVRITFDTNIRASNKTDCFGNDDLIYDYPVENNSVLEVKYDGFLPDFIAQALETNRMTQTSNSKYRTGRELYNSCGGRILCQ